jgi:Leu/Phe-tRNA-protein transferase
MSAKAVIGVVPTSPGGSVTIPSKSNKRCQPPLTAQRRPKDLEQYIPQYLRQFVAPYRGDFCYSPMFDARLISALMAEGFLPIATQGYLLPKLHEQRCIIRLNQGGLHVSKSARKKSKRYNLTVNQAFKDVVQGCQTQHGNSCWLYDPLVSAFESIYSNENNTANIFNHQTQRIEPCRVRIYSVEIWNVQGDLVGGELAYSVGSILTSLTGFCREDGAGTVQLTALGRMLTRFGFDTWDLGMEMDYKSSLGAVLIERADFVRLVHSVRHKFGHVKLPTDAERYDCRELIDWEGANRADGA